VAYLRYRIDIQCGITVGKIYMTYINITSHYRNRLLIMYDTHSGITIENALSLMIRPLCPKRLPELQFFFSF
jgi:hypothetical protein